MILVKDLVLENVPMEFIASMFLIELLACWDGNSLPIDTGSSDSGGESEKAEPTLELEEEDLGAGLQEEDEDDMLLWNGSISIVFGVM